jgi:GTP cyclohydrolase IA
MAHAAYGLVLASARRVSTAKEISSTHRVLITLGSNVEREGNLRLAVSRLRQHPRITLCAVSPVYETAPVGSDDQPPYFNAAIMVETDLRPAALRDALRAIERDLGRVRTEDKYAPRTIDLDIALYGNQRVSVDGRPIPDPDITRFPHLAIPLADVAPDWKHPERGVTLRDIADSLSHSSREIRKVMPKVMEHVPTNGHYAATLDGEPGEVYDAELESLVRQLLVRLGEDPEREGLQRTPLRVAKALDFLTSGYRMSEQDIVRDALFSVDCEEMVVVKDVEFYSLCEHHLLPFFGRAHVSYLPNGKVIGLSKVARIIDVFARRLQLQERLTNQVADALMDILGAHGVAVVMEASHFCMVMRGVQKQNSQTVTSAMRGTFRHDARTRAEFTQLIRS